MQHLNLRTLFQNEALKSVNSADQLIYIQILTYHSRIRSWSQSEPWGEEDWRRNQISSKSEASSLTAAA